MARQELARFLRERRAALRPAAVGLAPGTVPRRTPGLGTAALAASLAVVVIAAAEGEGEHGAEHREH
ncbi:hypothetical protein ABZ372_41765, partial [Streptomyces sp. NPDC005921]